MLAVLPLLISSTAIPCSSFYNYSLSASLAFQVAQCLFDSFYGSSSGSAISISSSSSNLSVCESVFSNCNCSYSYEGGAIFCVICDLLVTRTCALECVSSDGQFLWSSTSSKATLDSICLYHCGPPNDLGHSGFRVQQGCHYVSYANFTRNYLYYRAPSFQSTDLSSIVASFMNIDSTYSGMEPTLWIKNFVWGQILSTNFINNSSPSLIASSVGAQNLTLTGCVIQKNNASLVFDSQVMIYVYSSFIDVNGASLTTTNLSLSGCALTSATSIAIHAFPVAQGGESCLVLGKMNTAAFSCGPSLIIRDYFVLHLGLEILQN